MFVLLIFSCIDVLFRLTGTNMPGASMPPPPAPVFVVPPYGPDPQITVCPSCHASIQTRVEHKPNTNTHVIALLLLLL